MNNGIYRPGRVRVSADIEHAIFRLVEQEKDVNKKKKHPAWWYRDEVAKLLNLQEKNNPSIRSYEEMIRKIRIKLRSRDTLDNPWCIGDCMKYGISGSVIPLLIRIKKTIGDMLTSRRAKWISLLYPAIEELVTEQYPDDPHQQEIRYAFISREYAIRERLCLALGRDFDTTDFDTLFFTYRDISEGALLDATGDNIFFKRPKREVGEFSLDDIEAVYNENKKRFINKKFYEVKQEIEKELIEKEVKKGIEEEKKRLRNTAIIKINPLDSLAPPLF